MKSTTNSLPNDPQALQDMVVELQSKVTWYEEQFGLFQQQRFGSSSEKNPDQLELFNEAEALANESLQTQEKADCRLSARTRFTV